MAEALNIIPLDVLPLPLNLEEVQWKQYLFYMIAYCDTFHDFAKERKLEGEGRSVSSSDIPNRVTFVQELIEKMDTSIPFNSYLPIINSFKSGTFENNVYSAFTRLLNNPLINSISNETIKANIKAYLPSIFSVSANEELIQQDMNERAFQTPGQIPPINTKIIELYMPAVVYGDTTKDNFISFLKGAYPECLDGEILKIVEDTASFPRNIFTTKLDNFKKIITTQTKWDPAGLSSFESRNNQIANETVSAPSFRSTEPSTSSRDSFTSKSAYFNQATNTLIYPGGNYTITKAGPSVNHLFMHMALEGNNVSPQLKEKFKQMIRAAKKDSKKNMVLPLDPNAGTDVGKDVRLRRLTSSKRSGDYENIHSAIQAKALMFTGDEPAFTYGVLNKCPIVFHSCSVSGHHFKLYIPPPADPEVAARAMEERTLLQAVLKAAELQKFFGITDIFYRSFFKNLKDAVFSSSEITVHGNLEAGRFLQIYMSRIIHNLKEDGLDAKWFRDGFRQVSGSSIAELANYSEIDTKALQAGRFNDKLKEKLASIGLPELERRNASLEEDLVFLRRDIPLKFHRTLTHINAVDSTLFKPNTLGQPFLKNGSKGYKLEPGSMFPQYKHIEGNIGGIAKLLNLNAKLTNQALIMKNKATINSVFRELNYSDGEPTVEKANEYREYAIEYIDTWLVTEGGKLEIRRASTKRMRNNILNKVNNTRRKARYTRNLDNKYKTIHDTISKLNPSKMPFKISPQDYADMLVYRLVINDVILEIMPNEPVIYQEETNMIINDPIEIQDGGAPMSDNMKSYCIDLYGNHIEPFFRKHLEGSTGSANDMLVSVLRSVVGGTFIQDVELLLNEIGGSPEFPGDVNIDLYETMKTNAIIALDGIFNRLNVSYNDPEKILKIRENQTAGIMFNDIGAILTKYSGASKISDTFFPDMNTIINYLNTLFMDANGIAVTRKVAEDALNKLPDEPTYANKDILQNYVKYALNDYLEVEILGVPPTSVGGFVERAISRQRRRRNGSPRRKSLKNR
jgi:hypothetical protein